MPEDIIPMSVLSKSTLQSETVINGSARSVIMMTCRIWMTGNIWMSYRIWMNYRIWMTGRIYPMSLQIE